MRDDGTFGFEEYRRDPEDLRGWFPLHRYSTQVYATEGDALAVITSYSIHYTKLYENRSLSSQVRSQCLHVPRAVVSATPFRF